eukprot:Opistho-2@3169
MDSGAVGYPDTVRITIFKGLLPLFGHSVAITADGKTIAVGAPGYGQSGASMSDWSYSGAFMLLTRASNGTYLAPSSFVQLASPKFWDRFGSRVVFSPDGAWLFVTANGGWRGASVSVSASTSTMGSTGVHVYRRNDTSGAYSLMQSIASNSLEPFGLTGVHVACGGTGNSTYIVVRDYVDDALLTLTTQQQQQNKTLEAPVQTGAVLVFSFNGTRWTREQVVTSADPRGTDQWFGVGLAAHPTQLRFAVGAPKTAKGVHLYSANATSAPTNATSTSGRWSVVHTADNVGISGRGSFFWRRDCVCEGRASSPCGGSDRRGTVAWSCQHLSRL